MDKIKIDKKEVILYLDNKSENKNNNKNISEKQKKNKKKIGKYGLVILALLLLVFISSKVYFNMTRFKGEIDSIVIYLEDVNKDGKRKSKTVENTDEIDLFLKALNTSKVSKRVRGEDVETFKTSTYRFYDGENLIKTLVFLGNTSEKIVNKDKIYKVKYEEETLYKLYEKSKSKEIEIKELKKDYN